MTDRELLERAAKAAGLEFNEKSDRPWAGALYLGPSVGWWNPLTDDGDALRLAVKLGLAIDIDLTEGTSRAHHEQVMMGSVEHHKYHPTDAQGHGDALSATRRAIVRAAAAMSKQMPLDNSK